MRKPEKGIYSFPKISRAEKNGVCAVCCVCIDLLLQFYHFPINFGKILYGIATHNAMRASHITLTVY